MTILFCIIGIPISMLAMKSVGELLAIGVRFLIVRTDTIVLKRAQRPGTVKVKAFVMSCTLICFLHVILATASTTGASWRVSMPGLQLSPRLVLATIYTCKRSPERQHTGICQKSVSYAMAFSYLCHMFWVLVSCLVFYRALLILLIK